MLAETTVFAFWASFFGFLFAKELALKNQDPVDARFRRLCESDEVRPSHDLLLSANETPATKRLKQKLILAGLKRKSDLEGVLLFKRLSLIVPIVLTATLFLLGLPARNALFAGILFLTIFTLLPRLWLLHAIFKRRKEIERNLPDALDLLIICLEAGLSFDSSLVRVAEEEKRVSTHISRELVLMNREILAGKSREEALKNLAWRCGIPDLNSLVGAILQSVKLGTSLVKTLKIQAETLRHKRRERIRAQILKTPVKLIFPLLLFIFPTLIVVILGPSLINIFRHLTNVGG